MDLRLTGSRNYAHHIEKSAEWLRAPPGPDAMMPSALLSAPTTTCQSASVVLLCLGGGGIVGTDKLLSQSKRPTVAAENFQEPEVTEISSDSCDWSSSPPSVKALSYWMFGRDEKSDFECPNHVELELVRVIEGSMELRRKERVGQTGGPQGESGSIPSRVAPRCSYVGIVLDDAAGRQDKIKSNVSKWQLNTLDTYFTTKRTPKEYSVQETDDNAAEENTEERNFNNSESTSCENQCTNSSFSISDTQVHPNDIGLYVNKKDTLVKPADYGDNAPNILHNIKFWVTSPDDKYFLPLLFVIWYWRRGDRGKQKLSTGELVSERFNRWKHALEVFDNHENGIPLRGHRESGRLNPDVNSSGNEGNFRELFRFREDSGDLVLSNHLKNSSSNATYICWRTQNEIISCGKIITSKVDEQVNSAKCFSIFCDETTDIATKEQMSLCKGYDGALAMSGVINGVQAHLRYIHPTALYVHCSSHALHLSVSDACSVPSIRNCMGTIQKVYDFFNTPKLQAVLHELCPIRCVQRHDSVNVFLELFDSVLLALEKISNTWTDRNTTSGALTLQSNLQKCEFLLSLFVVHKLFSFTLQLSKYIQNQDIDLVSAPDHADNVYSILQKIRENAEEESHYTFEKVKQMCTKYEIPINIPRVVGKQTMRLNVEHDSPETYYRRSVFTPFVDTFLNQLEERFLKHKHILQSFQVLVPHGNREKPSEEDEK
ncbi:hypothetical protein PR048_008519 [Dryococelus australis]|uniref:DUF4371 domain-containing protein n=1 Tax=Dryococelus australis TaxID=614101 RepID=A0ABQ9HXE8_9NEOP|nr:hypothetical protein PR048_008519 [Dryococelus australis]